MRRRGLHSIKEPGLLGTLRERGLPVREIEKDHSGPGVSDGSNRVAQRSEDVIMGDTYFDTNNDDEVMDISSVDTEAGSVASDSPDESIGKVPMYI
jgi:hypothetical protein